jgi:hypothetical protein
VKLFVEMGEFSPGIGSDSRSGVDVLSSPSPFAGEESSESCLLFLLMGKNPAESFKENSFMPTRLFFGGAIKIWHRCSSCQFWYIHLSGRELATK